MFTGSNYLLSSLFQAGVFVDHTNAVLNSQITLPTLSGNGTQSIYLQGCGTVSSYQIGIYSSNYIYTSSTSSLYGTIPNNTTICLTWYQSSGNPWSGGVYPSWTYTTLGSNYIPLANNVDLYAFYTQSQSDAIAGIVGLPTSLVFGQCLRIKDVNGYLATTQLSVVSTNSNTINGNTTQGLNTNGLSFLYTYIGNGSGGNLMLL